MEWSFGYTLWSILYIIPLLLILVRQRQKSAADYISAADYCLPPSPPGWPIFGNMFQLGAMPHHTLAGLREKYGPVLWLRLGSINTMVVQSAKAASELFRNNDAAFADRTITELMKSHDFHTNSLSLASYGPHWRMLRRICTTEMVTVRKVNDTEPVRKKCIDNMLTWIREEAKGASSGVHVARFVFLASFNMLGNLMFSRDLAGPTTEEGSEFFESMERLTEWTGHPNIVDVFPFLKWVDPQGLKKRMDRDMGKALEIAAGFVRERVKERESGGERKKDFLDVLLDFEGNGKDEPEKITEQNINTFILELFIAGTETTSSTTEWAMTELLCNPQTLIKVKNELNNVLGPNKKLEEKDIDHLPYLQGVVRETMRLHPPIPFLVPRKAVRDTEYMGYQIPKNTQLFINTWAIGRDPDCWDEPNIFKPERFIGSNIDFKGQNYALIPFGAGRRMCAGVPLGHRMLHLLLGSLIHEFEWELADGMTPENMDRREKLGVTVRKMDPLIAKVKKNKK